MTDYTVASGDGQLMIRDLGGNVEFWVKAGYTNFSWDGLSFNVTVNGGTTTTTINYPSGANWYRVWVSSVTSSQTVTFRLNTATGTSSLAGPTSISQYIDRGSAPSAPSAVRLSNVKIDRMDFAFTDGSNGGLAIDNRELWYNNVNTTTGARSVGTPGSGTIYALSAGTRWYVWARTHNSKGWSPFSPVVSAVTLNVPDAPSSVSYSNVGQNSVHTTFRDNGNGGSAVTEHQLAYNTTNDVSTATIIAANNSGDQDVTGLTPGRLHYFWARTANYYGWGPWSVVTSVQLIAGAYVYYNGGPKRAVPYVNVNGVWRVAKPWVRSAGSWKEMAQ